MLAGTDIWVSFPRVSRRGPASYSKVRRTRRPRAFTGPGLSVFVWVTVCFVCLSLSFSAENHPKSWCRFLACTYVQGNETRRGPWVSGTSFEDTIIAPALDPCWVSWEEEGAPPLASAVPGNTGTGLSTLPSACSWSHVWAPASAVPHLGATPVMWWCCGLSADLCAAGAMLSLECRGHRVLRMAVCPGF